LVDHEGPPEVDVRCKQQEQSEAPIPLSIDPRQGRGATTRKRASVAGRVFRDVVRVVLATRALNSTQRLFRQGAGGSQWWRESRARPFMQDFEGYLGERRALQCLL